MTPGTQLVIPAGFRTLKGGERYSLLHPGEERVILASFSVEGRKFWLHYLSKKDFQYGLDKKLISRADKQDRFPPWLSDRANECPPENPSLDPRKVIEQADSLLADWKVVDDRFLTIESALQKIEEIFAEIDPIQALNRHVTELNKVEGAKELRHDRYRLWFVVYVAFGRNRWALLPPKSGRGKYDREAVVVSVDGTARPAGAREAGHPMSASMKELVKQGFVRHAALGMTLAAVYEITLTKEFGCIAQDCNGVYCIQHPQGEPFPTYGQFRHWVVKLLRHEVVWSKLLGEQMYRSKFAAPQGRYSEGVQDLLEKVMSDAAMIEELPKSYFGEGHTLPLCEVVDVDVLSGFTIGIAFAVGAEAERIYAQLKVAEMLPASKYGEVLGLKVRDEDWRVGQLPQEHQSDRGKGATKKLQDFYEKHGMSYTFPATYTPQSNAQVEAVHERSVTVSGAPQFKLSALTPIQLAQQRYLSVIAENKSRDVTDRLTPEQLGSGIRTSHQLWNHYFDADRIQGCKPDLIDVLRTLPKRVFKIVNGYLSWGGARYKSADFAATDFAKQIRKHEGEELIGYAFDISNLVAWVEVERKLLEVKYVPNVRETATYSALTSDEVALHDAARKANKAGAGQARRAAGVHKRTAIPEQTGAPYRPVRITRTRPKQRGPAQVAEMKAHRE